MSDSLQAEIRRCLTSYIGNTLLSRLAFTLGRRMRYYRNWRS